MQPTKLLIDEIEAFLLDTGVSATRFGVLAAGDTKFVKTLREGRQPRETTAKRVRAWMKSIKKRK